jgi:GAF domain-containing protein
VDANEAACPSALVSANTEVDNRAVETNFDSVSLKIAAGIRAMMVAPDVFDAMNIAVDYAMDILPVASDASVTLVARRYADTPAYRGDVALALDKAQYKMDQGPCLDAAMAEEFVHSPDLSREQRWPHWTGQALEAGIGSVACYRLFSENAQIGALNLYATEPEAFGANDLNLGLRVAAHISAALTATIADETGSRALSSRTEIGQAEGILMERLGLSAEQAFTFLCRLSQDGNRKLRDIAAEIARTGEIP